MKKIVYKAKIEDGNGNVSYVPLHTFDYVYDFIYNKLGIRLSTKGTNLSYYLYNENDAPDENNLTKFRGKFTAGGAIDTSIAYTDIGRYFVFKPKLAFTNNLKISASYAPTTNEGGIILNDLDNFRYKRATIPEFGEIELREYEVLMPDFGLSLGGIKTRDEFLNVKNLQRLQYEGVDFEPYIGDNEILHDDELDEDYLKLYITGTSHETNDLLIDENYIYLVSNGFWSEAKMLLRLDTFYTYSTDPELPSRYDFGVTYFALPDGTRCENYNNCTSLPVNYYIHVVVIDKNNFTKVKEKTIKLTSPTFTWYQPTLKYLSPNNKQNTLTPCASKASLWYTSSSFITQYKTDFANYKYTFASGEYGTTASERANVSNCLLKAKPGRIVNGNLEIITKYGTSNQSPAEGFQIPLTTIMDNTTTYAATIQTLDKTVQTNVDASKLMNIPNITNQVRTVAYYENYNYPTGCHDFSSKTSGIVVPESALLHNNEGDVDTLDKFCIDNAMISGYIDLQEGASSLIGTSQNLKVSLVEAIEEV